MLGCSLRAGSLRGRKKNRKAKRESGSEASGSRSVNRERTKLDAGEPVDIAFHALFRPLVIRLLQISQGGNETCKN